MPDFIPRFFKTCPSIELGGLVVIDSQTNKKPTGSYESPVVFEFKNKEKKFVLLLIIQTFVKFRLYHSSGLHPWQPQGYLEGKLEANICGNAQVNSLLTSIAVTLLVESWDKHACWKLEKVSFSCRVKVLAMIFCHFISQPSAHPHRKEPPSQSFLSFLCCFHNEHDGPVVLSVAA